MNFLNGTIIFAWGYGGPVIVTLAVFVLSRKRIHKRAIFLITVIVVSYIQNGEYNVIAAFDDNKIIGFGALCESHSLYAEGASVTMQEFYVLPDYRSQDIGKERIQKIIQFGKIKEWKRLELCTPPVPEFNRTVEFYKANSFEITGGYKKKYVIA